MAKFTDLPVEILTEIALQVFLEQCKIPLDVERVQHESAVLEACFPTHSLQDAMDNFYDASVKPAAESLTNRVKEMSNMLDQDGTREALFPLLDQSIGRREDTFTGWTLSEGDCEELKALNTDGILVFLCLVQLADMGSPPQEFEQVGSWAVHNVHMLYELESAYQNKTRHAYNLSKQMEQRKVRSWWVGRLQSLKQKHPTSVHGLCLCMVTCALERGSEVGRVNAVAKKIGEDAKTGQLYWKNLAPQYDCDS